MWLSLHLYRGDNPYGVELDALLVERVAPLVERLAAEGRLRRYFFVRYRDPLAHLRLRLEPARPEERESLREAVLSAWGDAPAREVEYVPEWDRYGGPTGVDLAEDHFHLSSEVALAVLAAVAATAAGRGRAAVLGKSVLLTVVLAWSFLDDLPAVRGYLAGYANSYARRLAEATGERIERAEPAPLDFQAVDGAVAALVSVLAQGADLGNPLLDRWRRGCAQVRSRLREACRPGSEGAGGLDEAALALAGGVPGLLASYLHMHHNRLGLSIHQEVALTDLLAGSLVRLEMSHAHSTSGTPEDTAHG